MSKVIAIAGKGGTGKTTVSGLLIRYLKKTGKTPILAVDADPDSNLPYALGMTDEKTLSTIGRTRQEFFDSKGDVPAGMPKESFLELKLSQSMVETKDVDLIVMGRPEGSGCYCFINNVLRKHLEVLGKNYPYVIIDNEAGLEHLSRRTAQNIDCLVIVSDYSLNGLRASLRIKELSDEMNLTVGKTFLIVNDAPGTLSARFEAEVEKTGLVLLGYVPEDSTVPDYDIEKKPLVDLPDDSAAVRAVNRIAEKLFN
ncbi:MAG: AAA family ATPase [Pseudomonadota bacterium]